MPEPREIELTINGERRAGRCEPRTTLVDFLRETCALTGTHVGCEHGVCGACTVLLDGAPVRSCLMFAVQAAGARLTTVEGLAPPGEMNDLQRAFQEHHALQCGFCTPGILTTMTALLADNPTPTREDVRRALSGNICRCTGYEPIVQAVLDCARGRAGRAG
ncbi:MAG: (2Fe-2S)-binding protein [Burkholderiales bacterium]|nr:(2Fe-2S)-binding protein [Burkholderiales bacterium]